VKETEAVLKERVKEILSGPLENHGALILLLQKVQVELGYVPEEAVFAISEKLGVPASEVFGVLTFYAQFRLTPRGKNVVRICRGTACHVRGSPRILSAVEKRLGIQDGETTPDMEFTLETIACFGSCSLSPVMVVNEDIYGRLTPEKALDILEGYGENAQDH